MVVSEVSACSEVHHQGAASGIPERNVPEGESLTSCRFYSCLSSASLAFTASSCNASTPTNEALEKAAHCARLTVPLFSRRRNCRSVWQGGYGQGLAGPAGNRLSLSPACEHVVRMCFSVPSPVSAVGAVTSE